MVSGTDFHPEDVKSALRKKFGSLQRFEDQAKLPRNSAAAALRRPYLSAERAIARALRLAPASIWPSRYDPRGRRLSPQPSANYASARGVRA